MNQQELRTFLEASVMLIKNEQEENANNAWIAGYNQGKLSTMEVILELLNKEV